MLVLEKLLLAGQALELVFETRSRALLLVETEPGLG